MIKVTDIKFIRPHFILGPLSLTVKIKSTVAVLGNNGAGKTTLINLMANILTPCEGNIFIGGVDIHCSNSYKKTTGFVLSEPYYLEYLTTKKYLKYCSRFHKMDQFTFKKRLSSLYKTLNFTRDNIDIAKLSSGDKMKVTILSALIFNPDILILDEPFVNIDIRTQESLKRVLTNLKNDKTLLITSNNLDIVSDICDTFLILDNGKIVARFEADDFESTTSLKNSIKKLLTKDSINIDLNWLN